MVEIPGPCLDLEAGEVCWGRLDVLIAAVGEVMTSMAEKGSSDPPTFLFFSHIDSIIYNLFSACVSFQSSKRGILFSLAV